MVHPWSVFVIVTMEKRANDILWAIHNHEMMFAYLEAMYDNTK